MVNPAKSSAASPQSALEFSSTQAQERQIDVAEHCIFMLGIENPLNKISPIFNSAAAHQMRLPGKAPYLDTLVESNLSYQYTRSRGVKSMPHRLGAHGSQELIEKLRAINTLAKNSTLVPECMEIGCGEGRTTYNLAQQFKQVTFLATDLYPPKKTLDEIIELDVKEALGCRARLGKKDHQKMLQAILQERKANLSPFTMAQADAMNLRSDLAKRLGVEKRYDCIFSVDAAPYMPDQVKCILEIWHCLKVGGVAVFGTAPGYFGNLADELFPKGSDTEWSRDRQSVIIRRTSETCNLMCQHYRWLAPLESHLNLNAKEAGEQVFLFFSENKNHWHNDHPFPHSLPSIYQPPSDQREPAEYVRAFWR